MNQIYDHRRDCWRYADGRRMSGTDLVHEAHAEDAEAVARRLAMSESELIEWHQRRSAAKHINPGEIERRGSAPWDAVKLKNVQFYREE